MNAVKTNADYVNREFPEAAEAVRKMAAKVFAHGPARVVTEVRDGVVCRGDAPFNVDVNPDYALIRHDEWSLGYLAKDEAAAEDLWAGDWIARVNLHTGAVDFLNVT